jgi:hypothetical protein
MDAVVEEPGVEAPVAAPEAEKGNRNGEFIIIGLSHYLILGALFVLASSVFLKS